MKIDGKEFIDPICVRILAVLLIEDELRSDKLLEVLNKSGEEVKKANFFYHLKHLEDKKIIIRDEKTHKNVVYRVNSQKFEKFKGFLKYSAKRMKELNNEKEILSSFPIKEQINEVISINAEKTLNEIKLLTSYRLYHRDEDGLMLLALQSDYFKRAEYWLIENCYNNDNNKTIAFNYIDELINGMHPREE